MQAKIPKQTWLQKLTLMVSNLTAVLPGRTTSLSLPTGTVTVASLISDFQSVINEAGAVTTARADVKTALEKYRADEPAVKAKFAMVEAYLKSMLGPSSSALEKVGITPSKPRAKPSPATRVASNAKAKATRTKNAKPKATPPTTVVVYGAEGHPISGSESVPASANAPVAAPAAK